MASVRASFALFAASLAASVFPLDTLGQTGAGTGWCHEADGTLVRCTPRVSLSVM